MLIFVILNNFAHGSKLNTFPSTNAAILTQIRCIFCKRIVLLVDDQPDIIVVSIYFRACIFFFYITESYVLRFVLIVVLE